MRTFFSLLIFLSLSTPAQAGAPKCQKAIEFSIAEDVEHITWLNHEVDVRKYAEENRFGTRDYSPLHIEAGKGSWCVHFGSLRNFMYAMNGTINVVVTVNGMQVVNSTDVNEFQVFGLHTGDEIKIEFIKLYPFATDNCGRKEDENSRVSALMGGVRPHTTYTCDTSSTRWVVIEERVYTAGPELANWADQQN